MKDMPFYLACKIRDEVYAINVKYIQRIIEYPEITSIPNMPPSYLGIIDAHGEALPLIDSQVILGLPHTKLKKESVIIVIEIYSKGEEKKLGFLVNEVLAVVEIKDEEIKATPSLENSKMCGAIEGIVHRKEYFLLMLNPEILFAVSNPEKVCV